METEAKYCIKTKYYFTYLFLDLKKYGTYGVGKSIQVVSTSNQRRVLSHSFHAFIVQILCNYYKKKMLTSYQ